MKTILCLNTALTFLAVALTAAEPRPAASAADASALAARLGVAAGVVALPGDAGAATARQLARNSNLLLYVQLADAAAVETARRAADEAGLNGRRIFITQGSYARLHLADNVVDALVAIGEAATLNQAEALRVLHPQGKALLGEKEITKPVPAGLDDWSHPYHLPDNNPVSKDQVARGPYLTQFLGDPRYAPLPQVAVASAGRVFKAFGHIAFKEREEPWLNTLAAFNGYNGALLWRRETAPALMVHRNTLIATPDRLYFGDDQSCKVYAAATGELLDEIAPAADVTGGTFWKWMALEGQTLYAAIGEQEQRDPTIRTRSQNHGWPWNPLSPGFNSEEHTWGFARTLLAIDVRSKKIRWTHREAEPIDTRAVCLKNGRLYAFRFGAYLVCLDAKNGHEIWRNTRATAPQLFASLGEYSKRQDWRTNWRTIAYLKASDQALFFAGPAVNKILAASTEDGRILWEHPYDNYQIVLRDDGLYGIGGQIDKDPARRFDPLTGRVLEEYPLGRRACTRVTSSIDAVFCRAHGGSTRFDVGSDRPELVSPMRPNCHDGVTIANGLLYWWPSVCDCNLTLYGITCLGPAGTFDFSQKAIEAERLQVFGPADRPVAELNSTRADWPMFRANGSGTVTSENPVPLKTHQLWSTKASAQVTPTAPTAVGSLIFVAGSDGAVRALSAASGQPIWTAYTGGDIRYPPTVWQGRAYVGSGDGAIYCFDASSGRALWRFRAAPVERVIPVYGALSSTWPVGSGVLVENGTAYAAAGIVNYDGSYVFALDARTGRIKWQNTSSGHLDPDQHSGVSVQGHLMAFDGRLFMPGGNAVSPAMYDLNDGRCLNDAKQLSRRVNNNIPGSFSPRGSELYRLGNEVRVSGKPHYSHPKYPVYDAEVFSKILLASSGDTAVAWINNARLIGLNAHETNLVTKIAAGWGKQRIANVKTLWEAACPDSLALAVAPNAVLVATARELRALDLRNGQPLWTQPLPMPPVRWGLAINRDGRIIMTLEDGRVVCFSGAAMAMPSGMP